MMDADLTNALDSLDTAGRYKVAGYIMERYGDQDMADILNLMSAQMDFCGTDEGDSVLKKTRVKLVTMIKERANANLFIRKIRDCDVVAMSSGAVTSGTHDRLRSRYHRDGLYDPAIFGGDGRIPVLSNYGEKPSDGTFGIGMGHIDLPIHVVLPSDYHALAILLMMKDDDVKRVAEYAAHIIIESSVPDEYSVGQVLSEKEHRYMKDKYPEDFRGGRIRTEIGGEAFYELLCNLKRPDHPERLAFSKVPVIGTQYRPMAYIENERDYDVHVISKMYADILNESNELKKSIDSRSSDILVLNYARKLENSVAKLDRAIIELANSYIAVKKRGGKVPSGGLSQLLFTHRINILDMEKPSSCMSHDIESINISRKF